MEARVSIEVKIVCDGCGFSHPSYGQTCGRGRKEAHQMRTDLKTKLLWSVSRANGEDLCWNCLQERKRQGKL